MPYHDASPLQVLVHLQDSLEALHALSQEMWGPYRASLQAAAALEETSSGSLKRGATCVGGASRGGDGAPPAAAASSAPRPAVGATQLQAAGWKEAGWKEAGWKEAGQSAGIHQRAVVRRPSSKSNSSSSRSRSAELAVDIDQNDQQGQQEAAPDLDALLEKAWAAMQKVGWGVGGWVWLGGWVDGLDAVWTRNRYESCLPQFSVATTCAQGHTPHLHPRTAPSHPHAPTPRPGDCLHQGHAQRSVCVQLAARLPAHLRPEPALLERCQEGYVGLWEAVAWLQGAVGAVGGACPSLCQTCSSTEEVREPWELHWRGTGTYRRGVQPFGAACATCGAAERGISTFSRSHGCPCRLAALRARPAGERRAKCYAALRPPAVDAEHQPAGAAPATSAGHPGGPALAAADGRSESVV